MDDNRSLLGPPGFRAKSLHTCAGSMTPQVGNATRAIAADRIAFPVAQLGRHLEQVISELDFHACMPPVNASPPPSRGADA